MNDYQYVTVESDLNSEESKKTLDLNTQKAVQYYLEFVYYFLSYLSIDYYYVIIEPCMEEEQKCINQYRSQYFKLLSYAGFFVITHFIILFRGLRNRNYINIVYSISLFIYMTNQRPGFSLINHGDYAKLICYFILICILIAILIFNFLRYLKQKVKYFYLWLILFFIFSIISTHFAILYSKRNFNKGFNNQWLKPNTDNLRSECDLKEYYFPNYDFGMKILIPFQSLINQNCKQQKEKEFHQFFNKSMNSDINENKYQVYPNLYDLNFSKNIYDIDYELQNLILQNIKFYKNKNEFKADYWINFEDKNNPKLEIDIQEKPIESKIENQQKYNIIVIMFDAISRQQFFRSYKKTIDYLEKFYNSSEKLQSKGFQFFRGQSYIGYTGPNIKNYRFGSNINRKNKTSKNIYSIEHIANQEGYVTQYLPTECGYYYNIYSKENSNRHKYEDMTKSHHDNLGLICDQINYSYNDPHNIFKGPFSLRQRCFLGENLLKHNFDFILNLHKKYKFIPKYSYTHLNDGHEFTGQVAKYGDDDLKNFIIQLEQEQILNNTFVFFFSDHGNHMNPYQGQSQGQIELYNFMFNILVPTTFLSEDIELNLKVNEQRLINHQDLHKTLVQLMKNTNEIYLEEIEKNNFGKSIDLFHEIINPNRNCISLVYSQDGCICK